MSINGRFHRWLHTRRYLLLLVLSLALSAVLRLPYYRYDFTFVDEAWWANGANVLCQNGQLYRDVALDKNPPIFWFCALLFKLFGSNMNAMHAGVLFLVGLSSVLLFLLGTRIYSPAVGAAAALIHAAASTTYYIPRIIGMNTETLMVVFSIAAAFSFLLGLLQGRDLLFFLAGVLSSFAFLTKPVAITEAACLVLFLILAGSGGLPSRMRSAATLLMGFALGLGGFIAYLWHAGILSAWWEQAILYGFRYVGRISFDVFMVKSLRANLGFGLIFAWLFILVWLSRRTRQEHGRAYWFTAFWLASAFLGVAVGRRYYANYYIQVIPPLSLLGSLGLVYLWQARRQAGLRFVSMACATVFLISCMWFHSRTLVQWATLVLPQARELRLWDMGQENRRNAGVAEHLKRNTTAQDRIFVWGSKPQLFFLAGRPMATPWMDFDVADDYPPQAAESWLQARTAAVLRRSRPRYIVDAQRSARLENYPEFRSLVEQHYRLESEMAGVRLFRLRPDKP